MYIISKFHDYYDCIMKQGLDKTIIYHRDEEYKDALPCNLGIYRHYQEFTKKTVNGYIYLPRLTKASKHSHSYVTIDTGLLGFCGKQYLVIIFQHQETYLASCIYPRWLDKLKLAKLENYPKNIYQLFEDYLEEKRNKSYFYNSYYDRLSVNENNILAMLNNQHDIKISDELFIELECPLFLIYQAYNGKTLLIKNPPLKPFDFQCVLSPEIAFQEIALYIGNFLTKTDNPLQITDNKILCAAKGFDIKTSFRKPPSV